MTGRECLKEQNRIRMEIARAARDFAFKYNRPFAEWVEKSILDYVKTNKAAIGDPFADALIKAFSGEWWKNENERTGNPPGISNGRERIQR